VTSNAPKKAQQRLLWSQTFRFSKRLGISSSAEWLSGSHKGPNAGY